MLSIFKLGFPLPHRMSEAWVYVSMIVFSLVLLEERLGLSMQLLSIEYLSLAAEVTVVLLLLSFAWPQKNRTEHDVSSDGSESISWEPAKFFFLQNWIHRGLYLNLWRKQLQSQPGSSAKKPFHPPIIEDDEDSKIPAPWQDRLTHLLNRQGFDAILSAWLSLDGQHRGSSCVSMITLSTYSDLTSSLGAMVTEQAVQRIGKQLSADVSGDSLVARYLPDRFVVLHLAATAASCQKALSLFHERTQDKAFFQTAGEPHNIPCNISVLGLEARRELNATMDLLEEGAIEGGRLGKSIVSHEDNNWTETPVGLEKTAPRNQSNPPDANPNSSNSNSSSSGESEHEKAHDEHEAADLPNDKSSTDPSDAEDEQSASNDISAVASPDDIAALFAQINTQKSNNGASAPIAASKIERQPEPKAAISDPTPDSSDAASADDIAALFATVKPNAKAPAAPAKTPTPPKTPTPTIPEVDKTEAASADDIAALFASVKPSATAAKTTTSPTIPAETKPKPIETAKPVVDVDPSEAATADDISALFASVKPSNQAANAVSPTKTPVANKTENSEAAKPLADVDPSEAASADDIAALFASVKPTAKSPAVPAPAKATELSEVDRAETATADDIAALFATVKSSVKPETPTKPSNPTPASSPTPGGPTPTGEELSQAATPDDIASLLASIKPVAPAPSQPTKASKPEAPVIPTGEQLSETASLDDIAALFATVKPAAQSNSAKQATPAPSAPSQPAKAPEPAAPNIPTGEQLSETASADDIAALFAAVKPAAPSNSVKQSTPVAPAPTQPAKATEPAAPDIPTGEQLSETASADDIAALFATVKPAAQSNSAKQTTSVAPASLATKTAASTLPIPQEDLSANATLDDIEALFAAMKK